MCVFLMMLLYILLDRLDGLIIHYGNDTTSGIMTTLDGTGYNGNTIESYGNLMFLRFLTSRNNEAKGFNLTYRSGKL